MKPYRGFTKEGKEVKGWLLKLLDGSYIIVSEAARTTETHPHYPAVSLGVYHEVIPETVGQFTGLKDKNGKEACSQDLEQFPAGVYNNEVWEIRWDTIGGRIFLHRLDKDGTSHFLSAEMIKEGEIIGSIHKSPELLEEKDG